MHSERDLLRVARGILDVNMGMKQEERFLFFTDSNSRLELIQNKELVKQRGFLNMLYDAFEALRAEYPGGIGEKYESTRKHSGEPRENVWRRAFGDSCYDELLAHDLVWTLKEEVEFTEDKWERVYKLIRRHKEEAVPNVIAFAWFSTTHTRFRRLLTMLGAKYVSMPLITSQVLQGPMQADWQEVARNTELLHSILLQCRELQVTCPAGTQLSVGVGESALIHKDTGLFPERGTYGNLPAGEAYLVPLARSAEGKVAFTSAPGRRSIEPTVVELSGGEATELPCCTGYADELRALFDSDVHMRHFAELGIGTNPKATDVSSMIEGEKILGTVHVALGDDSSIGGSVEAIEHLDHIIVDPTLVATLHDGTQRVLLEDGRPLWLEEATISR